MKNFYNIPTMVEFNDLYCEKTDKSYKKKIAGIAYRDEVICGCCGWVFKIKELLELNKISEFDFEELPWIDISESIIGD